MNGMISHFPNFFSNALVYFPQKCLEDTQLSDETVNRVTNVLQQVTHILNKFFHHGLVVICPSNRMQHCVCCVGKCQHTSNQIIKRENVQAVFNSISARSYPHCQAHCQSESLAYRKAGRRAH